MKKLKEITNTAFKSIGLAMGVATLTLLILGEIETNNALTLLSIGVASLGLGLFAKSKASE